MVGEHGRVPSSYAKATTYLLVGNNEPLLYLPSLSLATLDNLFWYGLFANAVNIYLGAQQFGNSGVSCVVTAYDFKDLAVLASISTVYANVVINNNNYCKNGNNNFAHSILILWPISF